MPEEEQQRSSDNLQVDKGILASLKLDTILGWVRILLKLNNVVSSLFNYERFLEQKPNCRLCPIICYQTKHSFKNKTDTYNLCPIHIVKKKKNVYYSSPPNELLDLGS
ncbi:hypothetical protein MOUN0_G02036 [Monosporozyma unispora]